MLEKCNVITLLATHVEINMWHSIISRYKNKQHMNRLYTLYLYQPNDKKCQEVSHHNTVSKECSKK